MAIRPTGIVAGGVEVIHDERGHGGTVAWADVAFAQRPDGTPHRAFVVLPCPEPGCDSASIHPVSGGCDRAGVRELFARYLLRRAAALGLEIATIAEAREYVRQLAIELDGRD